MVLVCLLAVGVLGKGGGGIIDGIGPFFPFCRHRSFLLLRIFFPTSYGLYFSLGMIARSRRRNKNHIMFMDNHSTRKVMLLARDSHVFAYNSPSQGGSNTI